ncbi:helix-turn-helix domain-containing protein [Acidovorax sp. NPDC077664]
MKALGLRQVDLARLCQVAPASVAQWRNGRTKEIAGEKLLLAAAALQCSPKWLATGKGPMDANAIASQTPIGTREPDPWQIDATAREALRMFQALPPLGQAEALDYLKYLGTKHPSSFKTTGAQQRDPVPSAAKRAA